MEILNCWQQSWINIWVTSKKCQQKCKELEYIWIKFFINSITTILIYSAHNDKLNPCSLNTELSNLEITEFCITRDPCIQPCILLIARNCMQRRNMQFAVPTWWTREECIQHSVRQLHYYSDSKPHNGDTLPSFLRSILPRARRCCTRQRAHAARAQRRQRFSCPPIQLFREVQKSMGDI